jgi:signal peptidase I
MNFDYPFYLTLAAFVLGMIWLANFVIWGKTQKGEKLPVILEYAKAFFPILLLVLVFRSFVLSPFRVPTGSLEPTIVPGDFVAVEHFSYGLRWPVWEDKFLPIGVPKAGQIVVFHWPGNPRAVDFVKRVIGVPGDKISYINKVLYINGKKLPQKFVRYATDTFGGDSGTWQVKVMQETINGVTHQIYINPQIPAQNFRNVVVPKGKYFMMGDNRDSSDDSRYWGFVDDHYLIGRAFLVITNFSDLSRSGTIL